MDYEMLNGLQDLIDEMEDVYNRAISGSMSFARGVREAYILIEESGLAKSGKLKVLGLSVAEFLKDIDSEEESIQTLKLLHRFKEVFMKFVGKSHFEDINWQ